MVKATPENLESLLHHLPPPIISIVEKRGSIRKKIFIARIAINIQEKMKRNDLEKEVKRYCGALIKNFANNGHVHDVVDHYMGNGFARKISNEAHDVKTRKQKERHALNEALNKLRNERLQKQRDEEDKRRATFAELLGRDEDEAIRFAASLTTEERTALKLPRATLRRVIDLRKTGLTSTRVKEMLGCTDAELRRWSEDGRMPILFRRRIPGERLTLPVRFWARDDVELAQARVGEWREADRVRRTASRRRDRPSPMWTDTGSQEGDAAAGSR